MLLNIYRSLLDKILADRILGAVPLVGFRTSRGKLDRLYSQRRVEYGPVRLNRSLHHPSARTYVEAAAISSSFGFRSCPLR